jgi:hypothetical protein
MLYSLSISIRDTLILNLTDIRAKYLSSFINAAIDKYGLSLAENWNQVLTELLHVKESELLEAIKIFEVKQLLPVAYIGYHKAVDLPETIWAKLKEFLAVIKSRCKSNTYNLIFWDYLRMAWESKNVNDSNTIYELFEDFLSSNDAKGFSFRLNNETQIKLWLKLSENFQKYVCSWKLLNFKFKYSKQL